MAATVRKRQWTGADGKPRTAWAVRYSVNGTRVLKQFPTRKAADAWWQDTQSAMRKGTYVAPDKAITLKDAARAWLDRAEADGLEATTLRQYTQHRDLHILPYFGDAKVSDIDADAVKAFRQSMGGKGASDAMVKKLTVTLGAIFAEAVAHHGAAKNPVRDLPRNRRKSGQDKRHKRRLKVGVDVPTPDEVARALDSATGFGAVLFHLAALTGLRSSELRGLRWQDIGHNSSEIRVEQRADRYNKIGAVKSEKGFRRVPMTEGLRLRLMRWKDVCPASDLDLVLPTRTGTPWLRENLISRVYKPVWVDAGIVNADGKAKYPGLHCLRHYYASWCLNTPDNGGLGLQPKRVQELMGHSTLAVTQDTYGHFFPTPDEADIFSAGEARLMAACAAAT